MRIEECTTGLRRITLMAVAAILLALTMGCGEGECTDNETLIDYQGSEICATSCGDADECGDAESCSSGYCVPDDDNDDNGGNGDDGCEDDTDCDGDEECNEDGMCVDDNGGNGGDTCDPVEACADYCYQKSGRCLEENCGTVSSAEGDLTPEELAELEVESCEEGVEGDGLSIMGCLDRAQLSDASCQDVESDADTFAEQECTDQEQINNQCGGSLYVNLFGIASDVLDACDCSPANTAAECSSDEDCDDYGRGICGEGTCFAECEGWDGAFSGFISGDPTCAEENGMCIEVQGTNLCFNGCTAKDQCPQEDQGCLVVGGPEGERSAVGACQMVDPAESDGVCFDAEDCDDDEGCVEGNCQPACEQDEDCDYGPCGEDDICTIDFQDI